MKKRIYYIVVVMCFAISGWANDTTEVIPPLAIDSLVTDSVCLTANGKERITEFDQKWLEQSLAWLDTTQCTGTPIQEKPSDSVYMARLGSLPHVMEMPYNHIVRGFIEFYMYKAPRQVAALQRTAHLYFPIFEEALIRHNLPVELKYLPVVESALKATAISPMGAAGLWQFMPQTAKNCGLEVNSLIDERMDPIKSTEAACKFLKQLYSIYGDWNLAIAAYNCGPGNVNKAIHRSGGKRDFWDLYYFLPRETRSYVPIFIAANYAMNFADAHNICPDVDGKLPLAADTVMVSERLHLQQVAEITGVSMQDLRLLNPQYRLDVVPGGKDYALCLPLDMTGAFIQQQDTILKHKADTLLVKRRQFIDLAKHSPAGEFGKGGLINYKVKSGDTLGGIALKYKCSVKQIKRWNGLKNDNIRIGQKLKIYQ